jgi:hypothetical protein
MNKLNSLYKVNESSNLMKIREFELSTNVIIHPDFKEILVNYNVAKPTYTYYNKHKLAFNLNFLLGFSEKEFEDLRSVYSIYLTRMPANMLPIGNVDAGDLLCIDNLDGTIYYWFHEEDDWGLTGNKKYPTKVGENLFNFLDTLSQVSDFPTKEEIENAKKEGGRISITPLGLELLNKDRVKRGLQPLTIEEALANKR